MKEQGRLGLYLHWPFCLAICPYCDFNRFVADSIDYKAWEAAYLSALRHYADLTRGRVLHSVFFGGGTPSTMPAWLVGSILDAIAVLWDCDPDLEVTLEANPTSVEVDRFADFAAAGVNRVSLGVQALNDADLQFLGRQHAVADAMRALEIAHAQFGRVSFDLIYARPEQDLKQWKRELSQAVDLAAGHLSLYQLTIERNTAFYYDEAQGRFSIPDQDLAADFYEITQDVLAAAGLPAYEVSNHARPGAESRHNLIYWEYQDYIGIGPGAHGRLSLDGVRQATRDHAAYESWLSHVSKKGHGTHEPKILSAKDQAFERLMMGLRLNAGVTMDAALWAYLDRAKVQVLAEQGWLVFDEGHLRLTQEGLLRLNAILPYVFAGEARDCAA